MTKGPLDHNKGGFHVPCTDDKPRKAEEMELSSILSYGKNRYGVRRENTKQGHEDLLS